MKRYFLKNKWLILLLLLLSIFDSVSISFSANITKFFIDKIPDLSWRVIAFFALIYIIDILFILVFEYSVKVVSKLIYTKIMADMSGDLFDKVLNENYRDFYSRDSDYYVNMIFSDVKELYSDYFSCIFGAALSAIQFIVYSANSFILDWRMGLVVVISCALTMFVPKIVGRKLGQKQKEVSDSSAAYLGSLKDLLGGFSLADEKARRSFCDVHRASNHKYTESIFSFYKYQSWADIIGGFSFYLVNIFVFAFGISFIYTGVLSLSSFIAILAIVELIVIPSRDAVDEVLGLKTSKLIRKKIESFLSINNTESKKQIGKASSIVGKGVVFSADSKKIIDGMSFCFEHGKKYAIVGQTGSGKTSLVNVLMGRYAPDKGAVVINGLPLSSVDISSVIGAVDQSVFIFNASPMDNVTLFGAYDFSSVKEFVGKIGAQEIMDKDTLGENGYKLSGGERKKIGLLRALEKQPSVLIADELYAGLDEKNASEIKSFVSSSLPKDTIYIETTHDVSSKNMKRFDFVYFVRGGKIIGKCDSSDPSIPEKMIMSD